MNLTAYGFEVHARAPQHERNTLFMGRQEEDESLTSFFGRYNLKYDSYEEIATNEHLIDVECRLDSIKVSCSGHYESFKHSKKLKFTEDLTKTKSAVAEQNYQIATETMRKASKYLSDLSAFFPYITIGKQRFKFYKETLYHSHVLIPVDHDTNDFFSIRFYDSTDTTDIDLFIMDQVHTILKVDAKASILDRLKTLSSLKDKSLLQSVVNDLRRYADSLVVMDRMLQ